MRKGTPVFRRVNFSLFLGGFVTFAILYSTQPLLPMFSEQFHISPAIASLSLSVTTATLAVAMLAAGSLSEAWGRKSVMAPALLITALIGLFTAFSPNFSGLLILRVFQGIALSGLPAVAMAYLSEEVEPQSLGLAMGLYISGNSIGGMSGRIIVGTIAELFSWRIAFIILGLLSGLAGVLFWIFLPTGRNFQPRPLKFGDLLLSLVTHLKNKRLVCLYAIGFLLMGSFVTLYNYIGYLLSAPPYNLSQTLLSWIFILYLIGTFSSSYMGRLADKMSRKFVLSLGLIIMLTGAIVTLFPFLPVKIMGIALFTFGFFGSHSIASSWVGMSANRNKAQASSLYLFFYYLGSSVAGTVGGIIWSMFAWVGVIGLICFFLLVAFSVANLLKDNADNTLSQA